LIRTSGVPPIVSVMSLKTRPWGLRGMVGLPSGNGQDPTRAQADNSVCVDHGPNAVKIGDLNEEHSSFNDDPICARNVELKSAVKQHGERCEGPAQRGLEQQVTHRRSSPLTRRP
jgi:hypothetical protein